jgi:hypothetical protein
VADLAAGSFIITVLPSPALGVFLRDEFLFEQSVGSVEELAPGFVECSFLVDALT